LNSSVIKWPDKETVLSAFEPWIQSLTQNRPDIVQIGYFGSYARGDWGVGSDLDVLIILDHSKLPFEKRNREWKVESLPVPSDLLIYTQEEWERMTTEKSTFFQRVHQEMKWLYKRKK
jgi:hypothetical protein